MPNQFTSIIPKIIAMGLMTLRETCLMPQLVSSNYQDEARKLGDTIDFPLPAPQDVTDVVPSNTPPVPASKIIPTVPLKLDKWKRTDFHLTDKEIGEIDSNNFRGMQVMESARALAAKVNADLLAEYKGVYGYVGTAGTTPFATTTQAATDARKVLAAQICPKTMRKGVLNADAEANALSLAAFQDADKAGTAVSKIEGEIGRKFGIDWFMEDAIPTHTSTVLTAGAATVNGAQAAGVGSTDNGRSGTVSIAKATNASPLVKGDIISFAGDSQTYTVLADVTLGVGNTTAQISPALKTAKAGGEAMTLRASHVVNMVFRPEAFAFANRRVDGSVFTGGNEFGQITDPVTGITLALEISRQHKQTVWEFSVLYGCKLIRPEFAVRIAG
jgi:hypothetical protein